MDIKWKTKSIRKIIDDPKPSRDGEPCFVCGKHKAITEIHHVCPISEFVDLLNNDHIEIQDIQTHVVWLCPNCHAYFHKLHHKGLKNTENVLMSMVKAGYTESQYNLMTETLENIASDDYCRAIDGDDVHD